MDKVEEVKLYMPDFCCDVDVIGAFTSNAALQMFKTYEKKIFVLICLYIDFIKLTSFSSKKLLEATSGISHP